MKGSIAKLIINRSEFSRRSMISFVGVWAPRPTVNVFLTQSRSVSIKEDSWAAADLKKQGEKLDPIDDLAVREITEEEINNPSERIKKLVNIVLSLNLVEMHQLTSTLKKRTGVTDEQIYGRWMQRTGGNFAAPSGDGGGGAAPTEAAPAAPAKEKTSFDLKLGAVDAKIKIKIIKEVRTITGLGLKEAKELVEKAPVVIKEGVKKEEAEQMKKLIVDAGGVIELL